MMKESTVVQKPWNAGTRRANKKQYFPTMVVILENNITYWHTILSYCIELEFLFQHSGNPASLELRRNIASGRTIDWLIYERVFLCVAVVHVVYILVALVSVVTGWTGQEDVRDLEACRFFPLADLLTLLPGGQGTLLPPPSPTRYTRGH